MEFLRTIAATAFSTALDVAPIVGILVLFQVAVLRRNLPNLRRIATGFVLVLLGLTLFLIGLEEALFPIGETMARQLTAPETIGQASLADGVDWYDYLLVYVFAAAIGFATTVAEPSLIAVALKAEEISGGAIDAWGLRIAVAVGVAAGVALGCFRIVTGTPLPWYIIAAYLSGDCPDLPVESNYCAARLRQRRRHYIDRHSASGRRAGLGARRHGSRAQPADRRIWPHRVRQRLSHHVRSGLCYGGVLDESSAKRQSLRGD